MKKIAQNSLCQKCLSLIRKVCEPKRFSSGIGITLLYIKFRKGDILLVTENIQIDTGTVLFVNTRLVVTSLSKKSNDIYVNTENKKWDKSEKIRAKYFHRLRKTTKKKVNKFLFFDSFLYFPFEDFFRQ